MYRLLLTIALMLASVPAMAATYYVRTNGGSATQCTGLANVAYDGAGTGEACAWNSPTWAMGIATASGAQSRISGGDTLIIANGSYDIGIGDGGDDSSCGYAPECYMRPVPSGSSGAPTRILGENYATGCKQKPEIWGQGGITMVINLASSDWVELGCLEVTDRSTCILGSHPTHPCPSDTGDWARHGIYASDADNIHIYDVSVHGIAGHAFKAGALSNWLVERVQMNASGWAGWDGNVAGSTAGSNSGYMTFKQVEIAWNGCSENYPYPTMIACWGQSSGGYGDGFGTVNTGGTWTFEDSWVHHNTSDGLDMLYLDDNATLTIKRMRSYANAGQAVKTSGIVHIESSYLSGYCSYFYGRFGSLMPAGDSCRASGNTLAMNVPNITGVAVTLRYNTITGQGDVQIMTTADSGTTSPNAIVNIENNVIVGFNDWTQGDLTVAYYAYNAAPIANFRNNLIYNVKNAYCPSGSICTNPLLKNMTLATFDPRPLSTSPLRNAGDTAYTTPATDVDGLSRPQETDPTLGALEYIALP